jgi:hypothetical protein
LEKAVKLNLSLFAVVLAAAAGSSAFALDGAYTSNQITMTFKKDGTYTVDIPAAVAPNGQAISVPGTYKTAGGKVTIKASGDDQLCMGAEGVYTLAETDKDATFKTETDACAQRAQAMAATWTKK